MGSQGGALHVSVLPWLAVGHVTPFLELSARLGHHISFLSTPSILVRLDPSDLPPLVRLVPLTPTPLSPVQSTADLTEHLARSAVEGLQFGLALILIPLVFDQPLNARVLEEKGAGKEVPRDEADGRFDGEGIARTLRSVMLEEGGSGCRSKCRALKNVLGDKAVQYAYVDKFVEYLKEHRPVL